MADIFNGSTVKVYYNDDTGNRSVITYTNTQINELAAFPSFSMTNEVQRIETYDDEYANAIEGQKNVDVVEIVVNYIPTDNTHTYLDKKFDSKEEFQLTVLYNVDENTGRVENVMMNGALSSRQINGGKDQVVTMTYNFVPHDVINIEPRDIPSVLRRGDFGVGANGSVDYPQYEPDLAAGNAFVKISAGSIDNPASVDLMGIELVGGSGTTNSNIMMTTDGDLRLYARNNTVPWTRLFTSGESDTKYMAKEANLSDVASVPNARTNLDVFSKGEGDARYMRGEHNLSEITDAAVSRTNLYVYSKAETQSTFLQAANNLNDILDPAEARTNLGIMSSTESDDKFVSKTTTVNGHALTGDITISKGDVGLGNVSNDAQLKIASNLGDLTSIPDARSNLGLGTAAVQNIGTSGANLPLLNSANTFSDVQTFTSTITGSISGTADNVRGIVPISNGGTGASNVDQAKVNLQVDRLSQDVGETALYATDRKSYLTIQNNNWGVYGDYGEGYKWQPLPIISGGTGANDAINALVNFRVSEGRPCDIWKDSLDNIEYNSTFSFNTQTSGHPSPTTGLPGENAGNDWFLVTTDVHPDINYRVQRATCFQGVYRDITFTRSRTNTWTPWKYITGVTEGGTGATDTYQARQNLGLGITNTPRFYSLDLVQTQDNDGASGILNLNKARSSDGAITSQSRMYHEVQGGVARTTIHTAGSNGNRYAQFLDNGQFNNPGAITAGGGITAGGNITSSGEIMASGTRRTGVSTAGGGNKDIFLSNVNGDGVVNGWVNYIQGNWYNAFWQIGGERGAGTDLSKISIILNDEVNGSKSWGLYGSHGGYIASGRYKATGIAASWATTNAYMGAPYYIDTVSGNDNSYVPFLAGGTSSTGGYDTRLSMGLISGGTGAWPSYVINMVGDGVHGRYYWFNVDGNITTSDTNGQWGGSFIFQRQATSDRNLKSDIVYDDGKASFDNIMKFQPSTFKFTNDKLERTRRGVIAQDLIDIDPEYVNTVRATPLTDEQIENGEVQPDDTLALDNNVIMIDTAISVKYLGTLVEEQQRQIDELKAMIVALTNTKPTDKNK